MKFSKVRVVGALFSCRSSSLPLNVRLTKHAESCGNFVRDSMNGYPGYSECRLSGSKRRLALAHGIERTNSP